MIDQVKGVDRLSFTVHGDDRGSLVAIETGQEIDFQIRRVYYIYGTRADVVRGKHAHRDMKQIMLCVSGSCDVDLFDGQNETTVRLNNTGGGIYISGFVWREMKNFSQDCVLLVLTDTLYKDTEYVYDKEQMRAKD